MQHRFFTLLLLIGLSICGLARPVSAEFPLQNGDVWVMAGDSITAQHLHSNYFEAFCFARYPNLKFAFRNSGVSGHTIPTTLARFDYDIAGWKPTVVSVELGMNDKGGYPTDKFIANLTTMVERIRAIQARPVIFTASAVNDGSFLGAKGGSNIRLTEYATAEKEFAAQQKIPFADQFHPLIDVWAKNKPLEIISNAVRTLDGAVIDDKIDGAEHLRAFLAAQAKSTNKPQSMQGDPVHPGPNGQLMMAAALLKALGADGFVSSVTLDASGKLVEAKGCQVDGIKVDGGTITFIRLDECLPFPIPDGTVDVLPMYPTIEELSQYTLRVQGLKPGQYALKINGAPLAVSLSQADLEKGVNLTAALHATSPGSPSANPVLLQSRAILQAVNNKEGAVGQWRGLSKQVQDMASNEDLKTRLASVAKQVEDADALIRKAAQPAKLQFELSAKP